MSKLRSPIPYFGGKYLLSKKLLPLMPPHKIYVEPFGGAGSLLFAKEPSPVEVYNDIDSGLVTLFRVLRDDEKFEKFYKRVLLTPYSREEYYKFLCEWQDEQDEVEKAYKYYICARMTFGGNITKGGWSFSHNREASKALSFLSMIELLPEIHERMMRVQIEHRDFRDIFRIYDTENTFFYVDPPYIQELRKSGKYRHELDIESHKELVQILLNLKGKSILTCYYHQVYAPLEENNWKRIDVERKTSIPGRTETERKHHVERDTRRIETIFISPNCKNTVL